MDLLFPLPKSHHGIDYHLNHFIRWDMAKIMSEYRLQNNGRTIPYDVLFRKLRMIEDDHLFTHQLLVGLVLYKANEYCY